MLLPKLGPELLVVCFARASLSPVGLSCAETITPATTKRVPTVKARIVEVGVRLISKPTSRNVSKLIVLFDVGKSDYRQEKKPFQGIVIVASRSSLWLPSR
jgi:hypothetical protein